ncbi:MAG: hypothetical protein FGM14_05210 [Flavobacteriales bacterium]|nr:hypothetical protein [Flavobacteriales bacterium]
MEEWKSVPGFSDYEISDSGKIRSKDRVKIYKNGRSIHYVAKEKLLRVHPDNGFLMTDLIDDKGVRKTVYPHKAVAQAFIENKSPRKNKVVIHIDGDYKNNSVSNLKWSTYSESILIGFRQGKRNNSDLWLKRRLKYGPKGGNTSIGRPDPLNYSQKKRIVYLRNEKGMTLSQLAEKYNCSVSHIHKTIKNWVSPVEA